MHMCLDTVVCDIFCARKCLILITVWSRSLLSFSVIFFQEMKQPHDLSHPSRVDIPSMEGEECQGNGAVPRTFLGYRRSNGNASILDQNPDSFEIYFSRVLQKVYQTIERNDIRLAEQDKKDVIKTEWQQVAMIADRLLLTCFVCVTLTITGVVLLVSPASVTVWGQMRQLLCHEAPVIYYCNSSKSAHNNCCFKTCLIQQNKRVVKNNSVLIQDVKPNKDINTSNVDNKHMMCPLRICLLAIRKHNPLYRWLQMFRCAVP